MLLTAVDLAVRPDGRLIVGGPGGFGGAAQFLPDGRLDRDFGDGGAVLTDFDVRAMSLDSAGRVLLAGRAFNGRNLDFVTARYLADGSLDPTFGGGEVRTDFGTEEEADAIVLQADGRIVVAGITYSTGVDFAIARYLTDGSPDPKFQGIGRTTIDFGGGDFALDALVQADGRLVVAGYSSERRAGVHRALVRLDTDGSLDPDFGRGGLVTSGTPSYVQAVSLQADGALLTAGYRWRFVDLQTHDGFMVARYLG